MREDLKLILDKNKGTPWTLYCSSFEKLDGFPGCCNSCHEDYNEGYADLLDLDVDGVPIYVCCTVSTWLDELEKE